jgi:hypothetical protein
MTEKYVTALHAAREQMRAHRRSVVEFLSRTYERGVTEAAMQQLIETQATMDAIGRAIDDEELVATKSERSA